MKFSLLSMAFAATVLGLTPAANADSAGASLVQFVGPYAAPVPQQTAECDSNYSGACVPVDSDVDCASGSGNGPSYVQGPVTVTGDDIYELDRDGNGTGCES